MKKYFLLCSLLATFFMANAGSNEAILRGKSASGRTTFEAKLQDIYSFNEATYTVDGMSASFGTDLCSSINFSAKYGIFTLNLYVSDGEGWMQLYAIPSTFEIITNTNGKQHYKFKAIFKGKDPRPDKEYNTPEIELDCELIYEI